jgi:hypothetical protein
VVEKHTSARMTTAPKMTTRVRIVCIDAPLASFSNFEFAQIQAPLAALAI